MTSNWLLDRIATFGDRTALILDNEHTTYADLDMLIDIARIFLKANEITSGLTIAIRSDYSPTAIGMLMALMENGNIIVPVTNTIEQEIALRLDEGRCDAEIVFRESRPVLNLLSPPEPHSIIESLRARRTPGLILFSSGSTGKPKAMVHDLDRLVSTYKKRKPRKRVFLLFLMFDHIGGLNTLFNGLAMGATMVFSPNRDADKVASLIANHRVQVLPASPTFLNLMLMSGAHERHDLSSLRIITYGTETMPETLLKRIKHALPKSKLMQTFGTSETGIAQIFSHSSTSTLFKIDDPNLHWEIRAGELYLKSAIRVLGYLNASPGGLKDDGWFATGDMVERAENGFLRINGRISEVINVGGQKALPTEIESVLFKHPDVADCLVYAMPHILTGQAVAAEIVPTNPEHDSKRLKKSIKRFCRERLDAYKCPAKIVIRDATTFSGRFKKMRYRAN